MDTLTVSSTTFDPATRLRVRLRQNAVFSAAGGAIATAGSTPLADAMGFDQWWLLVAIGVGLVGFAALVWLAAGRPTDKLEREALQISIADASWVIGSVVAAALGVLSTFGVVVVLGQAAVVAFFGLTQAQLRHALGTGQYSNAPMS